MKTFVLPPNENWICDRFVQEWYQHNADISTKKPHEADVIWILADWCWNQIPPPLLRKKIAISIHHITPEKFKAPQVEEFLMRDQVVDVYHVPCEKTAEQIRGLTSKPILVQPFWVNNKIWFDDKQSGLALRKNLGIEDDVTLVGSFQRDTEGHDLISPKLEKGPDIFCDVIQEMSKNLRVEVLLGGWRRQYVMKRLHDIGVKFHYLKLPDFDTLNVMYNALDLYVVGSRYEGGPQSIVECASTKTPIISTDVGIASSVLQKENIFVGSRPKSAVEKIFPDTLVPHQNVKELWIPYGFRWFRELLSEMTNT